MPLQKSHLKAAGFIIHLLAAFFTVGFHQCDELFQVYEFAGYKLGLNNYASMPWEFSAQMRSGIEPLLVFTVTKLFYVVGNSNPFHVALFLRVLLASVSFLACIKLIRLFEKEFITEKAQQHLWAFGLLFWCLPYFHARLSSENFASTLFIYGFVEIMSFVNKKASWYKLVVAGFFMGLSFVCRFQLLFMVGGTMAWFIAVKRMPIKHLFYTGLGFVAAIGLSLLADRWLYGNFTLSWWNYLHQNLFQSKASIYGESPLYFYFEEGFLQLIPPFSVVIIGALLAFFVKFKTHVLTWVIVPFIALHFFVAHKELRFLFPVLNFIPIMILLYFQNQEANSTKLFNVIRSKAFINVAVVVNIFLLGYYTFKPADEISFSLKGLYDNVKGVHPVIYYADHNPYDNNGELNFFRNMAITTVHVASDTIVQTLPGELYYFSEKYGEPETLKLKGKTFVKIYSSFPEWFVYINVANWLSRVYNCTIYKAID